MRMIKLIGGLGDGKHHVWDRSESIRYRHLEPVSMAVFDPNDPDIASTSCRSQMYRVRRHNVDGRRWVYAAPESWSDIDVAYHLFGEQSDDS